MARVITSAQTLGGLLRDARKTKGLTQSQLGAMIHLRQDLISGFENGRTEPRFDTLMRMLAALELEIVIQPKQTNVNGDW